MTLVHLRVFDSVTNLPVAFRLRMVHANGTQACPLGRQLRFSLFANQAVGGQALLGGNVYHWIDGACEIPLEPGAYWLEVDQGGRFVPIAKWIEVKPGQAALRMPIEPARGPWDHWVLGDGRCHAMTIAAAALEGAGNGMDLVHLLAREFQPNPNQPADLSGLLQYSGQVPVNRDGACEVYVNTLNHHPILGAISILNCHRVVFPLASGTPESPDLWSIMDWCQQGHRKGGLVSWVLKDPEVKPLQGEALAAAILGSLDAVEISNPSLSFQGQLHFWYLLLNAGVNLPVLGASGKESNTQTIGSLFTACQSAGEGSRHQVWIEAARKGQSFISSGPFLFLSRGDGAALEFLCSYFGQQSGQVLQWLMNGEVVHSQPLDAVEGNSKWNVPTGSAGWLAVRIVDLSRNEFVAHSQAMALGGFDPRKREGSQKALSTRLFETKGVLSRGEYHPVKFREQILSSLEKAQKRLIMGS